MLTAPYMMINTAASMLWTQCCLCELRGLLTSLVLLMSCLNTAIQLVPGYAKDSACDTAGLGIVSFSLTAEANIHSAHRTQREREREMTMGTSPSFWALFPARCQI